ncbi:unnamed protein product [Caenorhabditis sp. 36 PRJEB53466]|nr:unnamed protein product [Caenorhabditis sp. 36 PRJEB53466]
MMTEDSIDTATSSVNVFYDGRQSARNIIAQNARVLLPKAKKSARNKQIDPERERTYIEQATNRRNIDVRRTEKKLLKNLQKTQGTGDINLFEAFCGEEEEEEDIFYGSDPSQGPHCSSYPNPTSDVGSSQFRTGHVESSKTLIGYLNGKPITFDYDEMKETLQRKIKPRIKQDDHYSNPKKFEDKNAKVLSNFLTSDKFTSYHFLPQAIEAKKSVQAILRSDFLEFLDLFVGNCDLNDDFPENCLSHEVVSFHGVTQNANLLHLAAAFSTPEFVRKITVEEEFTQIFNSRYIDFIGALDYYKKTVEKWLGRSCHEDRLTPVDVAAECDRVEIVEILLMHERVRRLIASGHGSSLTRGVKCFESYRIFDTSLLSRLIENGNFAKLKPENKMQVVMKLKEGRVNYAINVAAAKGDIESVKEIRAIRASYLAAFADNRKDDVTDAEEYDEDAELFPETTYSQWSDMGLKTKFEEDTEMDLIRRERDEKIVGYIQENDKAYRRVSPPPAAHILAQYGHYEQFQQLSDERKLSVDLFRLSPLVSMLQFSDNEVLEQFRLFTNVKREDLFFFISEVIVKNRKGLVMPVLKVIISNPDNFFVKPATKKLYEHYGLPPYIPLPLETALSQTENIDLVQTIAHVYVHQGKFTDAMIKEDGLRCIRFIQDRADRITDQLRLAIILLVLPLVNTMSDDFRTVMEMHLNAGKSDNVAAYVLHKYSRPFESEKEYRMLCGSKKAFCTAMSDAREIVQLWGGTEEDTTETLKFLSQGKYCGPVKSWMNSQLQSMFMTLSPQKKAEIMEEMFRVTSISVRAYAKSAAAPKFQVPVGMKINPYAMFVKENFKKDPNTVGATAIKDLSAQWNKLSSSDKEKYNDLSKEYNEKKLNEFKKLSAEEQEKLVAEAKVKKEEKAARKKTKARREQKKLEGRPAVPPNAYALFIKEQMTGLDKNTLSEKMKESAAEWKTLDSSKKQKYTDEAKKLNDQYHKQMEEWEAAKKEKKEKSD